MRYRTSVSGLCVLALVGVACRGEGVAPITTSEGATTTTARAGTATTTEGTPTTIAAEGVETGYAELNQAYAGEFDGTSVDVIAQWAADGADAIGFDLALQPFRDATGIEVTFEPTPFYDSALQVRVDSGNPPDLAQIALPGKMKEYADGGALVNLSEWFNVDQLEQDLVGGFVELGSHNGSLYGVFYRAEVKSIVWYPIQAFADAGYAVPTTWDELIALSGQIVADGTSPWCISIESRAFDGWVATDWMEDILLRTASQEIYSQWYRHEIPFNHPEVLEAAEYMSQIWFTEGFAYGGPTYINSTFIGDTQDPMFDPAGPQCWMQKQGTWIPRFWGANKDFPDDPNLWPNKPGEDVGFFYFPQIEEEYGKPVLGTADMFVMFNDRPEARALLQYLATIESTAPWIERGGFLAANKKVPIEWYKEYPNNELAVMVSEATTFGFDASDLMPEDVRSGTFRSGMIDWVAADGKNTEAVFQEIEDSWPTG